MIWGNALCQSYILWTLIFRKTIAHKIGILLLCDQEYGRKKSIRTFYATFMLWYCLVSINFLFQDVSMTVSYKTFRSCWCRLNHSQRDVKVSTGEFCNDLLKSAPQFVPVKLLWPAQVPDAHLAQTLGMAVSQQSGHTCGHPTLELGP